MEQTECPETSAHKIRTPGFTQKKVHNIQNKTKVWNQERYIPVINMSILKTPV